MNYIIFFFFSNNISLSFFYLLSRVRFTIWNFKTFLHSGINHELNKLNDITHKLYNNTSRARRKVLFNLFSRCFYFATSCEVPLQQVDGKCPNAKRNKRT